MRRILLITRNLPPLLGGMERLNWHLAQELSKLAELRVVGPEGSAALAPAAVTVREAPRKPMWKFLLGARVLARREARAWRPDMVVAGSGLTAPLARSAARKCGAQTAAYVHGLDVAVRHPVYRAIWLPAIRRMDRIIANSHATADLCRRLGVAPARIGIVHPGVEIPRSLPDSQTIARFRAENDLGQSSLLLSVGRLTARKGLVEFIRLALPHIVAAQPDSMLLIAGDAPSDALHAQTQTPDMIRAAAAGAGVGDHVRFLGRLADAELGVAYAAANVHVFPVRELAGDPEGFGMVAIEAAARGLPTVAFAAGGVSDAVAEGQSGYLIEPGDYAAFAKAVLRALGEHQRLQASCVAFAQGFAWPVFGAQLAKLLFASWAHADEKPESADV